MLGRVAKRLLMSERCTHVSELDNSGGLETSPNERGLKILSMLDEIDMGILKAIFNLNIFGHI